MLTDTTAIRAYFAKLGLQREVADVYLALHTYGPQSIAALARNSGVERTRIYRLIDTLLETNLIEVEQQGSRAFMKPAPIANITILIAKREQELKSLQDELGLIEQVLARNSLAIPSGRLQLFRGPDGFRQMQQNKAKAKTDILSLLHEVIPIHVPHHALHGRAINGPAFIKSAKRNSSFRPVRQELRFIPDTVFHITQNCDIYDDIVAQYFMHDDEVFGIEMQNKNAAVMQRQFFELLWQQATPRSDRPGSLTA
jgi:predicted transcriptional regulator